MPTLSRHSRSRTRRGFSLSEVLISLTLATIVLSAATAFAVQSWQTRRGWTVRETVDRDARFVGLSLARDAQDAGISVTSTPVFSSVDTWGDTLSLLSVPFAPTEAPVYPIFNDGDTLPTYPPGGTCGARCIDFQKVNGTYDLSPGDLVRLQVANTRRLLLLTAVSNGVGNTFRIEFMPMTTLINRRAGIDSLLLMRSGTSIQKLNMVLYYRNSSTKTLFRADKFNSSGQPVAAIMASNVDAFDPRLVFANGAERTTYSGIDADTLNDGNDILGLKIRAQIRSQRADPAVNNGQPVTRWYEWRVAPRNLLFEKNRL